MKPSWENSRIIHSSDGCCRAKFFMVVKKFGRATMSSSSWKTEGDRQLLMFLRNLSAQNQQILDFDLPEGHHQTAEEHQVSRSVLMSCRA